MSGQLPLKMLRLLKPSILCVLIWLVVIIVPIYSGAQQAKPYNYGDTTINDVDYFSVHTAYNIRNADKLANGVYLLDRYKRKVLLVCPDTFDLNFGIVFHKQLANKVSSKSINYDIELQNAYSKFDSVYGNNCEYLRHSISYSNITLSRNQAPFGFIDLFQNSPDRSTQAALVRVADNRYHNLAINSAKIHKLEIVKNHFTSGFLLAQVELSDLDVTLNRFYKIAVEGCKVMNATFHGNNLYDCYDQSLQNQFYFSSSEPVRGGDGYFFVNDTFTGSIQFDNFKSPSPQHEIHSGRTCQFNKCLLDAPLHITGNAFDCLKFLECEFGNNFKLSGDVDTIIFSGNCQFADEVSLDNLSNPIRYEVWLDSSMSEFLVPKNARTHTTLIFLKGFKFDKLRFVYDSCFQIPIRSDQQQTFALLKDKFALEGDLESAKRASIEFKKLRYQSGLDGGRFIHFFDKYYWAYGYDKSRPIIVICMITFFFSVVNFRFWTKMNEAYKVGDDESLTSKSSIELTTVSSAQPNRYFSLVKHPVTSIQNYMWVLLYTLIVLFSIRIPKDRLHFYGHGFAVSLYFVQYITGLTLLFFTLKFVIGL